MAATDRRRRKALPMGMRPGAGIFSLRCLQVEKAREEAFYEGEQFVWTLKWSHIHLFGMNIIFILLGGITLDAGSGSKGQNMVHCAALRGRFHRHCRRVA